MSKKDDDQDEEYVTVDEHGQIITVDDTNENRKGVRPPPHTFF